MKKFGYYPGCSLSGTGLEMDISTRAVAKELGIELWEVPDWNCCGASSAHVTDHNLALALPTRNLAIAEEAGVGLAVPCAACFVRCKASEKAVRESDEMKNRMEYITGRKYEGKYDTKNMLEIISEEVGIDSIKGKVKHPMEGLKAASYYGCLLVRPPEVTQFDDEEDPQSMDDIVKAIGGEAVNWNFKVECCGAAHPTALPKAGLQMTQAVLDDAKKNGAECIVCACPLCATNLDMRQVQIGKSKGVTYDLPVFYFTELLGMAIGLGPKTVGLKHHFVDPMPLLEKKGLLKDPVEKGEDKA